MDQKILVIGGTGMLGEPVARQLQTAGFGVRVLTRRPQKARALFPAPFEVVAGDVDDPPSLAAGLAGCKGVHINLHGLFDPDLERRGAEAVARAACQAGVQRIENDIHPVVSEKLGITAVRPGRSVLRGSPSRAFGVATGDRPQLDPAGQAERRPQFAQDPAGAENAPAQ